MIIKFHAIDAEFCIVAAIVQVEEALEAIKAARITDARELLEDIKFKLSAAHDLIADEIDTAPNRPASADLKAKPYVDRKWFDRKFHENNISARGVARRLGLTSTAICRFLNGQRKLQATEAEQIAEILDVSTMTVLQHAGLKGPDAQSSIDTQEAA
ncbi:MAG: helix-turn-helix transcriptional regulator [Stappiaceae bacterium]